MVEALPVICRDGVMIDQRERFEAWARSLGADLRRDNDDSYHTWSVGDAWCAWQARDAMTCEWKADNEGEFAHPSCNPQAWAVVRDIKHCPSCGGKVVVK